MTLLLLSNTDEGVRAQTVQVEYQGKSYVGRPLAWDGQEMVVLRRDGRMAILPVASDRDYQVIDTDFRPFSVEDLRQQLKREFGGKYQISVTRHFIVVHPHGHHQVWAQPFENLYTRFRHYFSSRQFNLQTPEFPMIAVVLKTREEFDRFLVRYQYYDSQILGYYSPKSNRIITYQQGGDENLAWLDSASTIIHEAAHQVAFNTGLHLRFSPLPRWISEGLAMLFEAPGINNSAHFTHQRDRINQPRLSELQSLIRSGKVEGKLIQLISGDELFRTDPQAAYALAWGLTFYLSEKMPRQYFAFLSADGQRKDFADYTSAQRLQAFSTAFGSRFEELESRMYQFLASLE